MGLKRFLKRDTRFRLVASLLLFLDALRSSDPWHSVDLGTPPLALLSSPGLRSSVLIRLLLSRGLQHPCIRNSPSKAPESGLQGLSSGVDVPRSAMPRQETAGCPQHVIQPCPLCREAAQCRFLACRIQDA